MKEKSFDAFSKIKEKLKKEKQKQRVAEQKSSEEIHKSFEIAFLNPHLLRRSLNIILKNVQFTVEAQHFRQPVSTEIYPNYLDIIEKPMDLGTMTQKVEDGGYADKEQFLEDMFLIYKNSITFCKGKFPFIISQAKKLLTIVIEYVLVIEIVMKKLVKDGMPAIRKWLPLPASKMIKNVSQQEEVNNPIPVKHEPIEYSAIVEAGVTSKIMSEEEQRELASMIEKQLGKGRINSRTKSMKQQKVDYLLHIMSNDKMKNMHNLIIKLLPNNIMQNMSRSSSKLTENPLVNFLEHRTSRKRKCSNYFMTDNDKEKNNHPIIIPRWQKVEFGDQPQQHDEGIMQDEPAATSDENQLKKMHLTQECTERLNNGMNRPPTHMTSYSDRNFSRYSQILPYNLEEIKGNYDIVKDYVSGYLKPPTPRKRQVPAPKRYTTIPIRKKKRIHRAPSGTGHKRKRSKHNWLSAAEQVLREQGGGDMSAQELVDTMLARGLITTEGKTPENSMGALLYVDLNTNGDQSRFIKVAPGRFTLRDFLLHQQPQQPQQPPRSRRHHQPRRRQQIVSDSDSYSSSSSDESDSDSHTSSSDSD